ncbi:hypothetical protein [Winogradskyella sp. PE311]|uniref:hypothetical protein n=1 Tax=Winogradskyella sp. PE311 TaxID=3366943 RepID=UPI00397F6585
MKTQFNNLILLTFFALFCLTSCQDEVAEISNPTDQEIILPNSPLAAVMSNVSANNGAIDDFLDDASCFSIDLPVTIVVSDITITVQTSEDLEELEELFEEFNDVEDFFDFIFPITIIFNDHSELVIENLEQLQNLISDCDDEDEVIECIDFVYPISFSIFNSEFNIVDTITIDNDQALHEFLDNLEDGDSALIVSLNYPVNLEYANGEIIEVSTNQELAEAIQLAEDDCNDGNENDCDEEDIELTLKECKWEIASYSSFPEFEGLLLEFNTDYTFDIILDENQILSEGNAWSVVANEEASYLVLTTDFEDLGGDWQIIECDDDRFEFVKNSETMVLEQVCDDDLNCSFNDISAILQECPWDFTDAEDSYSNYQMIFNPDGDLQITEGIATSAIGGSWDLTSTDNGVLLTFSELTAFQNDLGGDWLIIECDNDRLKIIQGDHYLILEQDCVDETEVFDCFTDFELVECANDAGEALFNLSADTIGLIDCSQGFLASFHYSEADAEANIGAILDTESYGSVSGQVYLRIEAENGIFQIFNVFLNAIECNQFECFESFDAVIELCDAGNDGFEVFDLTIAFANCISSVDIVTYYETQVDAESETNPLANPQGYTNISLQQTIYVRAEVDNEFEIFTIQLLLEDCSEENCTEEDVDAFLTSCIWNAVNYNGSDNLLEWNFDFESNSQIVVIYTDTQTIDATWTTSQSNEGVIVEFSNVSGPNIQAITGEWLVIECEENRLELHRGDDILVLERNCN